MSSSLPAPTVSTQNDDLDIALGDISAARVEAETAMFGGTKGIRATKLNEFDRLGVGVSVYFRFMEFMLYIIFVCALFAGFAMWVNAFYGEQTVRVITEWFVTTSLGNYAHGEGAAPFQVLADSAYTLMFLVGVLAVRSNLKRWTQKISGRTLTTGRFSVHVRHLPANALSPGEIAEFFSSYGKVEDVAIVLDSAKLCRVSRNRARAVRKMKRLALLRMVGAHAACGWIHRGATYWTARLAGAEKRIDHILGRKVNGTGHAFVTFSLASSADKCIAAYSARPFKSCFRQYFRDKHRLYVEPAPEPKDVQWENYRYSALNRWLRRMTSITLSVLIISAWIGFLVLVGMLLLAARAAAQKQQATWLAVLGSPEFAGFLSGGTSFGVWISNKLIVWLLRSMARFEKHLTTTGELESQAWRMIALQSLNSSIVVVAMHFTFNASEFYAAGGGASIVINILTLFAIGDPAFLILGVVWHHVKCKWTWYRVNVWRRLSADDLKEWYTPPPMPLLESYTKLGVFIFVALFFSPALPIAIPVLFVGLLIRYWTDKWLLIRHFSKPAPVGARVARTVAASFKYAVLIHALTAYLFYRYKEMMLIVSETYMYIYGAIIGTFYEPSFNRDPSIFDDVFSRWMSGFTAIFVLIITTLIVRWIVVWLLCLPLFSQHQHRQVKLKQLEEGVDEPTWDPNGHDRDQACYEPPIKHAHVTLDDLKAMHDYLSEKEAVSREKMKAEWDERLRRGLKGVKSGVHSVTESVLMRGRDANATSGGGSGNTLAVGLDDGDGDGASASAGSAREPELESESATQPDLNPPEGPVLWFKTAWRSTVHHFTNMVSFGSWLWLRQGRRSQEPPTRQPLTALSGGLQVDLDLEAPLMSDVGEAGATKNV